ncbi:hypothetical protein RGE_41030 [Rubrivivax gelatinosus IL144]|uniref:Uncharacterized protein n=1 Tax=Rubrivivax gelatinosus (strain NBRC 100245 / IL144) TaxID=983917 RepID=I0HWQ2_RUBGI|nr:hypothetical protein RGE_41030 [Rubrivivax gelatinosus IL144]
MVHAAHQPAVAARLSTRAGPGSTRAGNRRRVMPCRKQKKGTSKR